MYSVAHDSPFHLSLINAQAFQKPFHNPVVAARISSLFRYKSASLKPNSQLRHLIHPLSLLLGFRAKESFSNWLVGTPCSVSSMARLFPPHILKYITVLGWPLWVAACSPPRAPSLKLRHIISYSFVISRKKITSSNNAS